MDFYQERKKLVSHLKREGRIYTKTVENAFLAIPRENFVPENLKFQAYVDTPLVIGHGQTISAPHMVAIMVEALDLHEGQNVLEIGAGSGYHAAIVSKLVGASGHVYTVERISSLAENAKKNLKKTGITNVSVEVGDGSKGLPAHAPYDRIYVTCAAPSVPPPLIEQLREDGKLMVPIGRLYCQLELLEKKRGGLIRKDLGGCAFVPLVGRFGF